MPDEPVSNPGVTPTPKTPEYGEGKPRLGEGEEAQPTKPFSLGPEGEVPESEITPTQPSPMDVAKDAAQERGRREMPPEQLEGEIKKLRGRFGEVHSKLGDPNVTNNFSPDHYEALNRAIEKTNPDLRSLANNSETEFNPPQHEPGESVLNYVGRWLNGSQETLASALDYLSNVKTPTPGAYLKLQYSVQRAVQRGELFASIVGASVSGIKTIMSTQLG